MNRQFKELVKTRLLCLNEAFFNKNLQPSSTNVIFHEVMVFRYEGKGIQMRNITMSLTVLTFLD